MSPFSHGFQPTDFRQRIWWAMPDIKEKLPVWLHDCYLDSYFRDNLLRTFFFFLTQIEYRDYYAKITQQENGGLMKHNEDTRVKIPAVLHLMRLGYEYLSLKNAKWDRDTNIFDDIFDASMSRINSAENALDSSKLLDEIKELLDYEDMGRAFYHRLTQRGGIKLIDFENFSNNTLHVVTELTYQKDEDEFRPDIILLINGMPLAFIEVKKPNNLNGVLAERERINTRFANSKFNRFVNITQLMVFSNNMEYDDESSEPIQGAFYATPAPKPIFNYFREEEPRNIAKLLKPLNEEQEDSVLIDNHCVVIKDNAEFKTNKSPDTPTNRLSTALFSPDRLVFLLQYAIAYVDSEMGVQKHIMRYPQFFATKAIQRKLDEGVRKGIIWHTQGSGKTALAFYNVRYLTHYFQTRQKVPKFYFIVDRIDLLEQAKKEFSARGLKVHIINSRKQFAQDIKTTTALHNHRGEYEITVVNIQKFDDDPTQIQHQDYDISIQRIYFLDEVHRSYNPKGSFLANLDTSDRDAIKIGLTGTPLLGEYASKKLFGDYIHKYYYNQSIADGYTLRLIREGIETEYKLQLQKALEELKIEKGEVDKKLLYAHPNFVTPMLKYIVEDFANSKKRFNDDTIGAMVICHSSEQAKEMFEQFQSNYPELKGALILHDVETKGVRKDLKEEFTQGRLDFLFVFNMLLTGFDAPRLKKLYLGRTIKDHGLLQALTRVNRTYRKFRYGFVVDFADISKEFEATNEAYFNELQSELGDEIEHYSSLFLTPEEIEAQIATIKETLWEFDTQNAELFSQQISQIEDITQMQSIKKVLGDAKSLYNLIRLQGDYELLQKLDFSKLNQLYREASNHLALLHQKASIEKGDEHINIINLALEDILFAFKKISEEELVIADKLRDTLRRTREGFQANFDKKDPEYITLKAELERIFRKQNLSQMNQEEMDSNIALLKIMDKKIRELNQRNERLRSKYEGDSKYTRIHKRITEQKITKEQSKIHLALMTLKAQTDQKLLHNQDIIRNESFFNRELLSGVVQSFKKEQNIDINPDSTRYIGNLIASEYIDQYHNRNYN